jgi:hypothetical protein
MPKQIQFEGTVHTFPDDFTDADIAAALEQAHPVEKPMASHESVNPLPGGALSAAGVATGYLGPKLVKPALRATGVVLEKAPTALKMAGGAVGGHIGGIGGAAAGMPFAGAYAGGSMGAKAGRAVGEPLEALGTYLREIGQKNPMIPTAARRAAVFAGRKGVRMLEAILPYAGPLGIAADLGSTIYDNWGHLADNINKSVSMDLGDGGGPTVDPKVRAELLALMTQR